MSELKIRGKPGKNNANSLFACGWGSLNKEEWSGRLGAFNQFFLEQLWQDSLCNQ